MEKSVRLNEMLQELNREGLRITDQRKKILTFILYSTHPVSAVDLYDHMKKSFHGLSYSTVYENIKLFMRLRLVEAVTTGKEILFRIIEKEQPQLHFTCIDCATTVLVDFNVHQLDEAIGDRFESVNYKLDIFGYCPNCVASKD